MPDTIRGNFTDVFCSDCGKKGCTFYHFGPLVLKGDRRFLCVNCANKRRVYYNQHGEAMPNPSIPLVPKTNE